MTEESLFHEALARPAGERAAFLASACPADPALRAAVERRLQTQESTVDLAPTPAQTDWPGPLPPTPAQHEGAAEGVPPPQRIAGRYKLLERIGEGGMGEVWSAWQEEPVKRKVALKLIKAGLDSRAVLTRFEQERQALALMDHPNIARVLDGGLTEDRSPFFVMELVDGLPLTRFCDEARLDVRQRLELFVLVCQAVQHAHQKGVIHRDLKPGNILVTMYDGRPVPRVIDFGIAKATASKLTADAETTQVGAILGTLEYMAPEQAGGSGDIDTRADVYSLGVVLYQLLVGRPPFDAQRLRRAGLVEQVRIICAEEPPRPSTRLVTDPSSAARAAARRAEPKRLARLLRGELDWVVLKCLEKQRERRYETASALGRDLQRYLGDEPVEARPPSAAYRMRKFLRRNKGWVTAGLTVLLVLAGGIVGTTWQAQRAEARRVEAEQARLRAQTNYQRSLRALDALTEELARGIRPIAGTQTRTVLEILDRAKRISDDLITDADAPPEALERKARLMVLFSELYRETNRSTPARQAAEEAVALFDRLLADQPSNRSLRIERAEARNALGWMLFDQIHLAEARAAFRASGAELEEVGAEGDPSLAGTSLASAYTWEGNILALHGNHDSAEAAYRHGLDLRRRALASAGKHPRLRQALALSLERFGRFLALSRTDRVPEGLDMLREARSEMEAVCAEDPWNATLHLELVRRLTNLAEHTNEAEAAGCVEAAQKVVDRFYRRDPDHILWQREDLRLAYQRIAHKLKDPGALAPAVREELRGAQHKVLGEMLAVILRRNAQDPENYLWLSDAANIEGRLAQSYLTLADADLKAEVAHLARARELARSSIERYERILARSPENAEVETDFLSPLYSLWKIEKARKDPVAAQAARWHYDARSIAQAHRLTAAYPGSKRWGAAFSRAYFQLAVGWPKTTDLEVLGRPEVVQSLTRLAAALADLPAGMPKERRDYGARMRLQVATLLRQLDSRGALSAQGRELADRLLALQ